MAKRGPKPGKSKSQVSFEMEERLTKVSHYYLMGWWHQDIATKLGVSRQTVTRDIKIIKERFKQAQVLNVTELKNQQLAELDEVKGEAWDAWERSKGTRETKQVRQGSQKGEEKSVRLENQSGDSQHLRVVLKAMEDKADLVGMAPPKQLNLNDISKRPTDALFGHLAIRLPVIAELVSGTTTTR